jgi:D-glycero-alpha-D-manno-heptose-7-phosphate kinase
MKDLVDESIGVLNTGCDITKFGELLHEAWQLKRDLSDKVSNPYVDEFYEQAREAGAIGGKITGAGGGGFMLLFVPPTQQKSVREKLKGLIHVPFKFESSGSQIIFFDSEEEDYTELDQDRLTHTIREFREIEPVPCPS